MCSSKWVSSFRVWFVGRQLLSGMVVPSPQLHCCSGYQSQDDCSSNTSYHAPNDSFCVCRLGGRCRGYLCRCCLWRRCWCSLLWVESCMPDHRLFGVLDPSCSPLLSTCTVVMSASGCVCEAHQSPTKYSKHNDIPVRALAAVTLLPLHRLPA